MKCILKTRSFSKLANKAGLVDSALKRAVEEMEQGLIDANLGGNVYKKRVPLGNKGKRGGSRTIIATNMSDRWFFVYCFLKKDIDNISKDDELELKELAKLLLGIDEQSLHKLVEDGNMEEIL